MRRKNLRRDDCKGGKMVVNLPDVLSNIRMNILVEDLDIN